MVVRQELTGTSWATPLTGAIFITGDDHIYFNFIKKKETKY